MKASWKRRVNHISAATFSECKSVFPSKLPAQVFCTCHQSLRWPNCSCLALEMGQIWPASEGKGRGISPQHRLGSVYEAWKAAATRHSSCCWWWGNDRPCSSAWGTCFFHEHAVVVATHYYNSIIHGNLLADISCYKHCWYSMIHCGANCFPSENYCIWQSALQRDGVQIKLGTWISTKIDEFCMVLSIFVHDFPFQRDAFFRFQPFPLLTLEVPPVVRQVPEILRQSCWWTCGCSHTRAMRDVVEAKERVFSNVNLKDNDTRWCWTEMNVVENYSSIIYVIKSYV